MGTLIGYLPQRLFNFPIANKGIKELEHEFLVFLGEFVNILNALKSSGIEFFIGIADEPVQRDAQHVSHFGRCIDRGLHLIAFIAADGRAFGAQVAGQILLADAFLFAGL